MKIFGEYEDKKLGPEYLELLTDLKTIVNYGKYSSQVISDSPDWEGKEGETLFRYQTNGTGWYYYNYFWVNSGWSFLRWTNSANALVPDAGSITTNMIQTGAVTENELGSNSVTISKLKTATSEVSCAGDGATHALTFTGGQYCHYPQLKFASDSVAEASIGSRYGASFGGALSSYTTNITLLNASVTMYAITLYHTSSGEDYWLWLLLDKDTKEVVSMSGAPDHVAYGNSNDFDIQPHPFMNFDLKNREIILIEKSQAKTIQLEAKKKNSSVLELVDKDYRVDFTQTYNYEPIHSGKFSPNHAPVLVEKIPSYIQVRKLVPMTEEDKLIKAKFQEDKKKEFDLKMAIKESSKQVVLNKLKITKEDFSILNDTIR